MSNTNELKVERNYPNRRLVPLDELIATRTKKVNDLIDGEPDILDCGDPEKVAALKRRIDEYSSIPDYLRELQYYRAKDGKQ